MAEDIRIAIIGHGFMGHEHEKMLNDFPGIKLVGIADKDPKQLEDVKEGIKRYTDNKELFDDPEVDVVIIAANNNQHHDLVLQAAAAKKDIICEKPVAMSLEELDDMEKAVRKNGVKFTVHQQLRCVQVHWKVQHLRKGMLSALRYMESRFLLCHPALLLSRSTTVTGCRCIFPSQDSA